MINNKKYILFDLDGTLTDPKVGICTCVQKALKEFGIEEPDLDKLEPFIGPPLKTSFMEFYGMKEEDAEKAIKIYRERYAEVGKFENEVYDGIPELLKELKSYGYHLAVASSKPECFVVEIMEHFHIAHHFDVMVGSELDGSRVEKEEVIQEALNRMFHYKAYKKSQIVMVGDRKFDVLGAKELGVTNVAVSYGYGSREELETAGADYIVDSVKDLRNLFIDDEELARREAEQIELRKQEMMKHEDRKAKENKPKITPMGMVWSFLFPFLLFYFAGEFLRQGVGFVMMFLAEKVPFIYDFMLIAEETDETVWAVSGNGNALIQILSLIGVFFVLYKLGNGKENLEKTKFTRRQFTVKEWLTWIGTALAVAMGLNITFVSFGFLEVSGGYKEAAANLYAVGIPMGIILYGIFSPLVEELLFRGIIFTEVKQFMKPFGAVMISSALFGIYHGNAVQLVYSFFMGVVLAYAYHYSGHLIVPIVLHGIVNVVVFLASNLGFLKGDGSQIVIGLLLLLVGMGAFRMLRVSYVRKEKAEETGK